MSRPSLLCVPYRYKAGVLYSQVPSSNLGDFTVTRSASNSATRVNAAGLIETVADNVPRLDYLQPDGTIGCPALLVEPSAQNLCPRSQEIDLWSPTAATTTPNAAISPNGTQNAELFVPNSGSLGRTEINIGTLANATTYTMTCFMKQHTASLDQITLYVSDTGGATGTHRWGVNVFLSAFTLSNYTQGNGSVTSTSIENYGNGWYRIRVTGQVTSGMTSTTALAIRYFGSTANGTNGVLVFGAQFELGSVPTSYIPTVASPVTRGNESCTATVGPFNSGSIYIAISDNDPQPGPGTHSSGALSVLGASSLNLHLSRSNNTRNRLWTQAASVIYTTTQDNLRLAFTWNGASINVFENGTKVVTNSPYAITGVHTVRFGPAEVRNRITALAVYSSVLTDAQLQSLTQ